KLFIGGITLDTTEMDLKSHFEQFGSLTDVVVMRDKNTGKGRGFGFVTFNDPAGIPRFTLHGGLTDVLVADNVVRGRHEIRGPGISADDSLQTSKVFVGGIASTVTTQDLYEYFGKYGEVEDVQVMVDPQTHRSRGFAFVTFKHAETVQDVMNYQEHELHNKRVEIKLAVPKSVQRAQVRMLTVGTS
ncbi:hypothetical protein GUITHDRAFT_67277, partial [Guillardia theta CCMP2712]